MYEIKLHSLYTTMSIKVNSYSNVEDTLKRYIPFYGKTILWNADYIGEEEYKGKSFEDLALKYGIPEIISYTPKVGSYDLARIMEYYGYTFEP